MRVSLQGAISISGLLERVWFGDVLLSILILLREADSDRCFRKPGLLGSGGMGYFLRSGHI